MTTVPNRNASDLSPAIAASSRRTFMKMAAFSGLAAAGAGFLSQPVRAAGTTTADEAAIKAIFTVARTAEQLAVTFYRRGIDNAAAIGIHGDDLQYLLAAVVQEQLHQLFFTANGGSSLADTFSFPAGQETFTNQQTFFETQQTLEGVFDSAFLAAVREFAELGQSSLAQIAAQVACIESEHRVLGRQIGGLGLPDNRAYTPVLIEYVKDAPAAVAAAGFLSPVRGNEYQYLPLNFDAQVFAMVDGEITYKAPFAVRPYILPS